MDDQSKPKKNLINELSELRQQLVELKNSDAERSCIERDLQETKKKLQSLFDGIPVGLYRTTPEGRRLDVNSTLLQMARCPDRETFLKGNVIADYINPEDRERWQALMEREGIVCGFETKCRRYDGTTIWIKDTARIVHDSKGQVLYYEGAVEDITERKRAERKERQYANNLAFLSRTAMEFVEFPAGLNIYKFIGERMRELVDNSLVIVNSFDESTQCIQVQALAGISKMINNIIKTLGKSPIGMSFPINDEARAGLAAGKLVKVPGGLYVLTFEKIPKYTCSALEKLLGLKNIYVIGFARKGELFGSIVILSRNGDWLKKRNLIEAFVGQSSVALQRSWAEGELKEYREHLEEMVGKRTIELEAANKKLKQEITERKNAEKKLMTSKFKLQKQKSALKQKNIALREVIAQIEMERKRIKEDIESNVNIVISPIIEKFKMASKDKYVHKYIDLLLYHLKKITSSSGKKLTNQKLKLTPREIEICNMVKGGLTSKEVSNILNISFRTVEKHRQRIRHKLGISNQDVNLTSFLRER